MSLAGSLAEPGWGKVKGSLCVAPEPARTHGQPAWSAQAAQCPQCLSPATHAAVAIVLAFRVNQLQEDTAKLHGHHHYLRLPYPDGGRAWVPRLRDASSLKRRLTR